MKSTGRQNVGPPTPAFSLPIHQQAILPALYPPSPCLLTCGHAAEVPQLTEIPFRTKPTIGAVIQVDEVHGERQGGIARRRSRGYGCGGGKGQEKEEDKADTAGGRHWLTYGLARAFAERGGGRQTPALLRFSWRPVRVDVGWVVLEVWGVGRVVHCVCKSESCV